MNTHRTMDLVSIYAGLADENRLRMVYLLKHGPLGVKHLQQILGLSQVRVSKHLAYLRERGMVEADRNRNWMIYRLPSVLAPAYAAQLDCLAVCAGMTPRLEADMAARRAIEAEVDRVVGGVSRQVAAGEEMSRSLPAAGVGYGWGLGGESEYVD